MGVLAIAALPRTAAAQLASLQPQAFRDTMTTFAVGGWGLRLADRDPSVRPGDNFFMSQNGGWFRTTTLAPGEPASAYWRDLRRLAQRRLQSILADAAADRTAARTSPTAQVGAFFRSFMDERTVEARGVGVLAPSLRVIRAATTHARLAALMGDKGIAAAGVFGVGIGRDADHPARNTVFISASGLSMPGPEFYLDSSLADFRTAFRAYVERVLRALDWPDASRHADDIVAVETRIAAVSWSHQQMRDQVATWNPLTVDSLARLAPGFDWRAFLTASGLPRAHSVVIDAASAFPAIARIFAETPPETWQARAAFAIADNDANFLNDAVFQAFFDFRQKQFNSQNVTVQPRGVRGATQINALLGDLIGALWVQRYYPPDVQRRAREMVANLREALDARLAQVEWMSPETRAKARAKLAAMRFNIGFPDSIPDYRGLVLRDDDLYGNLVRARRFTWNLVRRRLDEPFDPVTTAFPAQTVNYSWPSTINMMDIPAGMFEPPFYDPTADDAVNYGAVGTTIGQELMSSFDDVGRHYEADGRLHDWWTAAETAHFDSLKQQLSDEYSRIEPLPGLHVQGPLVVAEAIADLGGMEVALDAYHLSLHGAPAPVIDGFTGDQRFFLGRAQMWRAKFPPAFVRAQLATGRNAPPFVRVNGPIRHVDAWYEAFHVMPGDSMYVPPERRVHLW